MLFLTINNLCWPACALLTFSNLPDACALPTVCKALPWWCPCRSSRIELTSYIAHMEYHRHVTHLCPWDYLFPFLQESSRMKWVEQYANLIVLRTFSKSAALAGIRVGYGAFPKGLIDYIWRAKQPYNVSVASETAARAALSNKKYLEASTTVSADNKGFNLSWQSLWLSNARRFIRFRLGPWMHMWLILKLRMQKKREFSWTAFFIM